MIPGTSAKQASRQNVIYPAGRKKDGAVERGVFRFLRSRLLADCIAAFLLSSGLCAMFLPLTVLYGGLAETLGLVAVCVLILALLRFRWWLGPGLAALVGGVVVWRYYRLELLEARWNYWVSFAQWLREGVPEHEVFTGSRSVDLLKYLIIFGVALAVFFVLRRMFSLLLLLAAVGTTAVWIDYTAMVLSVPADFVVPLSLCAAGIVVLLPRVYARRTRHGAENLDRRGAMQMIAVPGAIVAVLLAGAVTPQETWDWRSERLSNFFYDFGYLFGGPFEVYNEGSTNFGLAALGFQPVAERLGGPAVLPDLQLLTVEAPQPVLLRGAVLDSYTGSAWTVGAADGDFRYDGLFWGSQRADAFDLDMPLGGAEARALYERMTSPVTLRMTYESEYYTTLFAAGQLQSVSLSDDRLRPDIFFNQRSELYLTRPVPPKTVSTVTARVFQPEAPGFAEDFAALEALAASVPDERYPEILRRYGALPDSLPASVREAAEEAAGDASSLYGRAVSIASWLGERADYTLNPPMPPPDRDFVEYFLETREGYCTYYATAMAVMARSVGIPSRYVTGFALERDPSREDTFLATGKTAHAWTELYFSGIGWVTFDPLVWNADEPLNRFEEQGDLSGVYAGYYEEEEEYADNLGYIPGTVVTEESAPENLWLYFLAALGLLAVGFLSYLAWAWNSKFRRFRLGRVQRKLADMPGRFGYYFSDIMRQLSLLGVPIQPGETLRHYPARVDARFQPDGVRLAQVADAQMRLHFAGESPTQAQLESAARYHEFLENTLRRKLSMPAYLWKRATRP